MSMSRAQSWSRPDWAIWSGAPGTTSFAGCGEKTESGSAQIAQVARRRDRFEIEMNIDQRRLSRCLRAAERVGELLGALDRLAMPAIGARQGGEVGIGQFGTEDAAGIIHLLMHADGAIGIVVQQDRDEPRLVGDGRREFLPGHQEIAVASEAQHLTIRVS